MIYHGNEPFITVILEDRSNRGLNIMKYKKTNKIKYTPGKLKPYSFRLYVGVNELNGAVIHRQRSFKTYEEALEALVTMKKAVKRGEFISSKKRYKFHDLVDLWLPQYRTTVKPSTYTVVNQLVHKHILGSLGGFYLDKLTVIKCQSIVNEWFKKYPKSYKRIYTYARKILDYGWRMELITSNPMAKVIKPRLKEEPKPFTNYYSKTELNLFLNACKKYNNPIYYTYFRLLAYTGLRPSEALALKWSDINIFNQSISVSRSVDTKEHNEIVIDKPKTKFSIRTIDIDDGTLKVLKEWHKYTNSKLVKLKDGYVFNNPNRPEGVFVRQDVRRWDYDIANANQLRYISPHGFRHTHASMLFSAGVQAKDVQERLGHSTIRTTLDLYVHLGKQHKKKAVSKFATFMEG